MELLDKMSRSGKEEKMSRKNGKKLLIAVAVGAVVVKAVRDVRKEKSRRKNSGLLWMIFMRKN